MSELVRRIDDSLAGWDDCPVLYEVDGAGNTVRMDAPELIHRRDEVAAFLRSQGVRRDDVVGLFLENSIDYVATVLALFAIRAVPVFAKLEYRRVELTTLFRDIDPDLVIAEREYVPYLESFLPGRGVIAHDRAVFSAVREVSRHHAVAGLADEAASINCTYRGCGDLLGSLATERQYVHGAQVLQDGLQGVRGEAMLYPIPLSHIFTLVGCLFVPLFTGMPGVIAKTVHPRILFEVIERLGVQHVTAVPEIYRLLMRSRRETHYHPGLRTFVSGGSRMEADDYHSLTDQFGVEVLHGYGLTEFTPVSRNSRGESLGGTVGPVCRGVDVRIADPDADGRGEIIVRSDAVSGGYYNRPQATRAAFRNGWFHTGDRGHFHGGHLVFDNEIKNTCKVNGVMVDLEEVRRSVLAASTATDATVVPDGNSLIAVLHVPDTTDIEDEHRRIRSVLKNQLAPYKIPRRVRRAA